LKRNKREIKEEKTVFLDIQKLNERIKGFTPMRIDGVAL
jgi:hypothetical protein